MTEADWAACTDPGDMLAFLRDRASDRKLRLLMAACCRRIWPYLRSASSRTAVELVEAVADGTADAEALHAAGLLAREYLESEDCRRTEVGCSAAYAAAAVTEDYPGERVVWTASTTAHGVRNTFYWLAYEADPPDGPDKGRSEAAGEAAEAAEGAVQAGLIRDIFGDPFRPVAADPNWLSPTVVALAGAIYAGRAYDRLPVLADALEEAGCDTADVLAHCRSGGTHVRGCWVLDMALGKG